MSIQLGCQQFCRFYLLSCLQVTQPDISYLGRTCQSCLLPKAKFFWPQLPFSVLPLSLKMIQGRLPCPLTVAFTSYTLQIASWVFFFWSFGMRMQENFSLFGRNKIEITVVLPSKITHLRRFSSSLLKPFKLLNLTPFKWRLEKHSKYSMMTFNEMYYLRRIPSLDFSESRFFVLIMTMR